MGCETWCIFNSLTKRVRVNAHRVFCWTLSGHGSILNLHPLLPRLLWWALHVSRPEAISPSRRLWKWPGKRLPSIIRWVQRSMPSCVALFFTHLFHAKQEGTLSVISHSPLWGERDRDLGRIPGKKGGSAVQVTPVPLRSGIALPAKSPPWADLEAQQGPLQIVVWAHHRSSYPIKPTHAFPLGTSSQAWSLHTATLVLAGTGTL